MNEIIQKRKSIRKYDPVELDAVTLEKVKAQIDSVTPLYPDIRYSVEIVEGIKRSMGMGVKAPHYLAFRSEEKEGAYENIGFIAQQMNLFFSASGLGACYIGMAQPEEKQSDALPFVICMAFGKPAEPLHRDISECKRNPLSTISEGDDRRLEAARLAPSAMNAQNWYFIAEGGKIHCYRKKPNPMLGIVTNKLGCIDMGIALCHIAKESSHFRFIKETNVPTRKGFIYMGTVGE